MSWRCWFRHRWYTHQRGFMIDSGRCDVVIAWRQCDRCGASRLVHILK